MGHVVRTCAIGMRIGEQLGLGPVERSSLFYALLLKDAGCSSNAARSRRDGGRPRRAARRRRIPTSD
jgi:hypothetical protein